MPINDIFSLQRSFAESISSLSFAIDSLKKRSGEKEVTDLLRSSVFYNGIIITIYGQFESLIFGLGRAYVDCILSIESSNIEGSLGHRRHLLDRYRENLGVYLSSPSRFHAIDENSENLVSLFDGYVRAFRSSEYNALNRDILLYYQTNMKGEKVFSFFRGLTQHDFEKSVFDNKKIREFLLENGDIEDKTFDGGLKQKIPTLCQFLDELVDQRNSVAHTGESDNRISVERIANQTIPFLSLFSGFLSRAIAEHVASATSFVDIKAFEDTSIIAVHNDCVVCHSNEGINIRRGDYLVFESGAGFVLGEVESIGKDNDNSLSETGYEITNFGFRLDRKIKKNYVIKGVLHQGE